MRIHVLQHVPFEGLGAIEDWLASARATVSFTRFFAGDVLPPADEVDGVIVMGGPMSVHDIRVHPWLDAEKAFLSRLLQCDVPLLGICLGAQLLAEALGARVQARLPAACTGRRERLSNPACSIPDSDDMASSEDLWPKNSRCP